MRGWYCGVVRDSLSSARLDPASTPLYEQVAKRLWADISTQDVASGDRLPAERTLAERYHVSRVTLRAALNHLESQGRVRPAASRGWFVAEPRRAATPVLGVQGFADYAAAIGLPARSRVLLAEVRPCAIAEADRLRIAPGADLFVLRRLRYLDDQIVLLEENQLPLAVCPALATTDFATASLYATLRASSTPVAPSVADYSVEARPPTAEEGRLLEIRDATPVLVATQLAYHQDRRPLEYSVAVYRGDRYRFRASITS